MARRSTEEIAANEARTVTADAEAVVSRTKCALTRANAEFNTANGAFNREAFAVRGIPVEEYPAIYWEAAERRGKAFDKLVEADDAYTEACEHRDAAKTAEIDAVHAAALVKMRHARRRAAQYHARA